MNELYGRGALNEHEIENNGIRYVLLEWSDTIGKSTGFSVHRVYNGISFQSSVPSAFSDDAIIKFCSCELTNIQ